MTVMTAPNSDATIDLPEELIERYEAAGWTRVEQPKTTAKK